MQSCAWEYSWNEVGTPHGKTILPDATTLKEHDKLINTVAGALCVRVCSA